MPSREQVTARVLGIGQVDVGCMVHEPPVDLFGHPLVEAAVSGFHVKHRNLAAFGGDNREAAVGVAEHQQRVGLLFRQDSVGADDDVAYRLRRGRARAIEKVVRLADAEFLEEYLVQLVIVVLPGMHQHVGDAAVELGDDARELDHLGPRADDRHYFNGHGNLGAYRVFTGGLAQQLIPCGRVLVLEPQSCTLEQP